MLAERMPMTEVTLNAHSCYSCFVTHSTLNSVSNIQIQLQIQRLYIVAKSYDI